MSKNRCFSLCGTSAWISFRKIDKRLHRLSCQTIITVKLLTWPYYKIGIEMLCLKKKHLNEIRCKRKVKLNGNLLILFWKLFYCKRIKCYEKVWIDFFIKLTTFQLVQQLPIFRDQNVLVSILMFLLMLVFVYIERHSSESSFYLQTCTHVWLHWWGIHALYTCSSFVNVYTYITGSAVMGVVQVYSEMEKNSLAWLSKIVKTVRVCEHQKNLAFQ